MMYSIDDVMDVIVDALANRSLNRGPVFMPFHEWAYERETINESGCRESFYTHDGRQYQITVEEVE